MTPGRRHILFVTPWYPTEDHEYDGVFVREHAKAVRLHHDVTVLHCQPTFGVDGNRRFWDLVREHSEYLTEGIQTYRLRYRPIFGGRGESISLTWALFWCLRRVARWHGGVDVIHAHVYTCGLCAAIVGRLLRIPTVVSEHSTGFPRRQLSRAGRLKARLTFSHSDMVLPVSESLKSAIESYGLCGNFRVVPNAVNTDLFAPTARRHRRTKPARLLFVGSLIERKGLPVLFEALSQLQSQWGDLLLDVVGAGPAQDLYRGMTAQLGMAHRVVFHGAKSKEDVANFCRRADVFVLPSFCETFSVATAEALAAGLPVLVTRCGGPEEFVTKANGIVVPPHDAGALAAALCTMLDRLDAYDLCSMARAVRERFGYEAVSAALDGVYSEVTRANTVSNPSFWSRRISHRSPLAATGRIRDVRHVDTRKGRIE